MSRRPRFPVTGYPLHVVQRGNDRQPCFFGEPDYLFYLHALREAAAHYAVQVHAYVLMTNHVHLLDDEELTQLRDATNQELAFGRDRLKAQIEAVTSRRTSAALRGRGVAVQPGHVDASSGAT